MQYHEHPFNEHLAAFVQTIWAMESENDSDVYPRSLIMPDGIVEIVFHYHAPFYTWQTNSKFLQPESFAVSMMKHYIEIASSGKTGFIAVRFFPWGAYHFFDKPIQEFIDTTIPATALWGEEADKLSKHLKSLSSIHDRFALIEQFLLTKLHQHEKKETDIDNAIKLIRETKGTWTIEKICMGTGLSKKQLERKMMATIGIMPKVFSRITRFLHICQNLHEYKSKSLTELSFECGFYDQAHFIKEFKAFSGLTPSEFFKKEDIYFSEI